MLLYLPQVERLAKLIESSPEEIVEDRMHIINLAANIDKRILKMYEVNTALLTPCQAPALRPKRLNFCAANQDEHLTLTASIAGSVI